MDLPYGLQKSNIWTLYFRSTFRIPTSRSYPRHLVQFREKRKKESILPPLSRFCSFHLLCCISSNVPRVPKGSPRFPKIPHGSPRFPKFPKITQLFSFVLLALTDHYIKSSDGGLWCEWNSDFFIKVSFSIYLKRWKNEENPYVEIFKSFFLKF